MSDVIVETSKGSLRGRTTETGVAAFKGVPYAAPPVGPLRFRPPQPVDPWTGVRDALEFGPSCPQPSQRPAGWTQESSESEDCLYLNVWSKATGNGAGSGEEPTRPVMVWIHGGGYAIGSGSWPIYDGANLAARGDVVVVTVNHRLGPLGYLHLDGAVDGNNGQLDLVAVLEWVRDEIAAFGGDAGNVTVFGESGGGAKISVLHAMPSARGLFHRAVVQSGPGLRVGKPERATDQANKLVAELGLSDAAALWDVPAEQLVAASSKVGRMGFGPVLDGTVVVAHPSDAFADGTAIDVPLLIGCNKDEAAGSLPKELDEAGLRERLATFGADHVDEILSVYRGLLGDGASNVDVLSAVLTDSRMRYGSIRLAELKGRGTASPAFQYFFTHELGGRAGHGYEIVFCFANTDRPLAEPMSDAWLAFARDGDPGHPGLPKWPAFTAPERSTMLLGRDGCTVADDPHGPARELWERLLTRSR